MNVFPGYEIRNGGNTSRFGSNRVFIFLHRTDSGCRWQAHCLAQEGKHNHFGAGDTPRQAYAHLIWVLITGKPPSSKMGAIETAHMCRFTVAMARSNRALFLARERRRNA